MPRIVPIALVVTLLAGSAAAFAVTERLKLVRSPIFGTHVEHKLFSPVCGCASAAVTVSFRLRKADVLTLAIVDGDGGVVRSLVQDQREPAGGVAARWNGRDDGGSVAPEGVYRLRVHLADQRRTIVLPNPLTVDTTPPRVLRFEARPRGFSPDRDGRNDKVSAVYELDEAAHALLFANGRREVRSYRQPLEGKLDWFGIVDGKPLRAGRVELTLAAEDRAGNVSAQTSPEVVQIRYVTLGRSLIRVPAGVRFGVRVETDASTVTWRFAGGRGRSRPGLLILRAPRNPREYALFVAANGHAARARVIVVPRAG